MANFEEKIVRIFVLCASAQLCSLAWAQSCPPRCSCPQEPPMCISGAQLVLDDCACCLVCARQKGEACSDMNPCDIRKGLYCDYAADVRKKTGVCMAREGEICLFDGAVYQNGETFYPSCKYQCTCRDGQIGCIPRCNLDVMLPGPDCPFPRKVQVPGECCDKWVCGTQAEVSPLGGLALAAYRQEETVGFDSWDPRLNCIEQATEWGACSRSCGMGTSTRVTNRNARCEMVKQSRLCIVRPCDKQPQQRKPKKVSKCLRTRKSLKPIHFTFKNCTSVQTYKPRYCGICSAGRCCTPHSTKTVQVEFRCPQGKAIKKPMMFINSCACHHHCPHNNGIYHRRDLPYSGLKI